MFPPANRFCAVALAADVAETMMLPALNPTETMPAPSKDTVRASSVSELVAPVVFPTAKKPRV